MDPISSASEKSILDTVNSFPMSTSLSTGLHEGDNCVPTEITPSSSQQMSATNGSSQILKNKEKRRTATAQDILKLALQSCKSPRSVSSLAPIIFSDFKYDANSTSAEKLSHCNTTFSKPDEISENPTTQKGDACNVMLSSRKDSYGYFATNKKLHELYQEHLSNNLFPQTDSDINRRPADNDELSDDTEEKEAGGKVYHEKGEHSIGNPNYQGYFSEEFLRTGISPLDRRYKTEAFRYSHNEFDSDPTDNVYGNSSYFGTSSVFYSDDNYLNIKENYASKENRDCKMQQNPVFSRRSVGNTFPLRYSPYNYNRDNYYENHSRPHKLQSHKSYSKCSSNQDKPFHRREYKTNKTNKLPSSNCI